MKKIIVILAVLVISSGAFALPQKGCKHPCNIKNADSLTVEGGIHRDSYYMVYNDGTTNKVFLSSTNTLSYENIDDDIAINWALSNGPNTPTVVSDKVMASQVAAQTNMIFDFFLHGVTAGTITTKFTESSTEYTLTDSDNGDGTGDCEAAGTGTALVTSCVVNYITGKVDLLFSTAPDGGTDITASFTHGRDTKYMVSLIGTFDDVNIALAVESYTILEGYNALLKPSGNLTGAMILNADQTDGNAYMELWGINQAWEQDVSAGGDCIEFDGVSDAVIKDVTVSGCATHGVSFDETGNGQTQRIKLINADISQWGDDGLDIQGTTSDIRVVNTNIHDNRTNTSSNSNAIEIEGGLTNIYVDGVHIYDMHLPVTALTDTTQGVWIGDDTTVACPNGVAIVNSTIEKIAGMGIYFQCSTGIKTENITLDNVTVKNTADYSLRAADTVNLTISNSNFIDAGLLTANDGARGMQLIDSQYLTLDNVKVIRPYSHGVYLDNVDDMTIINPFIVDVSVGSGFDAAIRADNGSDRLKVTVGFLGDKDLTTTVKAFEFSGTPTSNVQVNRPTIEGVAGDNVWAGATADCADCDFKIVFELTDDNAALSCGPTDCILLPTPTTIGTLIVTTTRGEYGRFTVDPGGFAVAVDTATGDFEIEASGSGIGNCSDATLCLYDGGTQVGILNNLGVAIVQINYVFD